MSCTTESIAVCRYLHKLYSQRLPQAQLPADVAYLGADYPHQTTCSANTPYQLFDAHIQLEAYRQRAVRCDVVITEGVCDGTYLSTGQYQRHTG